MFRHITRPVHPLVANLAHTWLRWQVWPQALALLAARLCLFEAFARSGWLKLQDWEATLFLFQEEYHVPWLPPEWAAWLGTGGELVFPTLLALGLLARPAALGLSVVNAVAVIAYPDLAPAALKDHHLWGVLALGLALFGAGRLSVDAWWWGRWGRRLAPWAQGSSADPMRAAIVPERLRM
ncbi:DoxX family protein [Aquabacterium sp.]|uniref:DoxX family protein n=1 Tax=Aquabacterium sp. TaxID=1872578 RepID=UPI0025B88303|nr:DoxX family protein [Aquabacterium sp.]